jgi:hypothetical protein
MAIPSPSGSGGSTSTAPTTTTTSLSTTTTTSPEQAFVQAVDQQLPTLAQSTKPPLTQQGIATLGHDLCTSISFEASTHGDPAGAASRVGPYLANGNLPVANDGGISVPAIGGNNNTGIRKLAVQYLCPQFSS